MERLDGCWLTTFNREVSESTVRLFSPPVFAVPEPHLPFLLWKSGRAGGRRERALFPVFCLVLKY